MSVNGKNHEHHLAQCHIAEREQSPEGLSACLKLYH